MVEIPERVFSEAVREFWQTRDRQIEAQRTRGVMDQGMRGAVTGGQQMNGFARIISKLMTQAGVPTGDIHYGRTELPGYFRATKDWDIVVVTNGQLLAVLELKAQVGSYGNNFNNRTEEAIGSAVDLWTAYREKAFKASPQPWLGYLFLLADSPGARSAVRTRASHFDVFPEFRDSSYAKRYELLCRRLMLERQYTATCFLVSDQRKVAEVNNYSEPASDLNAKVFLDSLLRQVARR